MQKEFVPYEISVKLKEVGFNEERIAYYLEDEKLRLDISTGITNNWLKYNGGLYISAPLFQQAFDWVRDNKNYHAIIHRLYTGNYHFHLVRFGKHQKLKFQSGLFNTYEKARETCLLKLIELIKSATILKEG